MNSTSQTKEGLDLVNILGLTGLSGDELDDMLASIGSLIMESVLVRVVAGLTEEEVAALDSYVSTNPAPADLYDYLSARVPDLDLLFEEESEAFREECSRILAPKDAT